MADIQLARKKPIPRSQRPELNRARQYKREQGEPDDISVSLMDMDGAIMYYFENVIKPMVFENGEQIKVPVMYASPERWYSINKNGFMRDSKRRIILPVIAFRRTGMEKDDTIAVDKIDPQDPKLFYTFERKFTDRNRYDNFSVQQGLMPQREYYNVAVPDYMVLNYDFIIFTSYIEQMNKLVERINWSAGSYWGEPGKMRFKTNIESFTDTTELAEADRIVKTEFSVSLKGYLIPDSFNDLQGPHTTQKYLTPKRLMFGSDVDTPVDTAMQQLTSAEPLDNIGGSSLSTLGQTTDRTLISTLANSYSLIGGAGVTITNSGAPYDGSSEVTQTISIPQNVNTTSNVQFNAVTASALVVNSTPNFTITSDGIQNIVVTGSLTSLGNMTVSGDAIIGGTVTAQEFHTEFVSASVISTSGSTQFGNTTDDRHSFTGSLQIQGSFGLDGIIVNEFTNDPNLASASPNAIPTEFAAKTYIDGIVEAAAQYDGFNRKQFVKMSTSITPPNIATFTAITASAPLGLTSTTENDFLFFINGQYMEHDALEVKQVGASFQLIVNNASIGYDLETDDEIVAWGKFNS
tara:strand:- start:1705 stop:3435 length:1731 start_codon:yes stop_codon:yes gene_type:complete